jgi:hypothetical protein
MFDLAGMASRSHPRLRLYSRIPPVETWPFPYSTSALGLSVLPITLIILSLCVNAIFPMLVIPAFEIVTG